MATKTVNYLVLDTETATLPFVNAMNLTPDQKKRVAIAKPLVYDIGWAIVNRALGVIERKNFLVAETFAVPAIFDTAYYHEKRPLYLEMLRRGEVKLLPWNDIIDILIADIKRCNYVCAYNAMFDFAKAIPFTELYIRKLYSKDYNSWEAIQQSICQAIANKTAPKKNEREFDKDNFHLRGEIYPMIDIWGLSCMYLLDSNNYRRLALENGYLSNTGVYFTSNAEIAKRYLSERYDFIEDHTALSDALIESEILLHTLKRGKRIVGIVYFPFRILGDVPDFVMKDKKVNKAMARNCLEKMQAYLPEDGNYNNYHKQIARKVLIMTDFIAERWGEEEE